MVDHTGTTPEKATHTIIEIMPALNVIAHPGFLTRFLMNSLMDCGDVHLIWHPNRQRGAHRALLKFAEATLFKSAKFSLLFNQDYLEQLRRIGTNDKVLIFGVENLKELSIIRRFIRTNNVSIFLWNPILDHEQTPWRKKLYVNAIKNLGEIYTFDPCDARNHGFNLTNQVYRNIEEYQKASHQADIDIYFIGQDKGRLPALTEWKDIAHRQGLSTHIHVVKDKNSKYSLRDMQNLHPAGLTYEENIKMIQRSRCLLEVIQKNQSGVTMRTLEAAFFKKKLITNNLAIRNHSLYDPRWIFLMGHDDTQQLKSFIDLPYPAIPDNKLREFDIGHWYKQFT